MTSNAGTRREDAGIDAAVVDQTIGLLRDLALCPEGVVRRVGEVVCAEKAAELARALIEVGHGDTSDPWLRCVTMELLHSTGMVAECHDVARDLDTSDLPGDVADVVRVTRLMTASALAPHRAPVIARQAVRRNDNGAEVAAASALLMDDCWRQAEVQAGMRWGARAVAEIDAVPSRYWRNYIRLWTASNIVDVGEIAEGQRLADAADAERIAIEFPCLAAWREVISLKLQIHNGRWPSGELDDGADACARIDERAGRRADAARWVAALYTDERDHPTAEANRAPEPVDLSAVDSLSPMELWQRLLLVRWSRGQPAQHAVLRELMHPAPDPRLAAVFATVPSAAALCVRTLIKLKDHSCARGVLDLLGSLVKHNPEIAALQWTVDHVEGLIFDSTSLLGRVAGKHPHAWVRHVAGVDVVCTVTNPATAREVENAARRDRPEPESWRELSDREVEVALLVAAGLTNQQVATRIGRTRHTVNFHLRNIYRKLGVASRVEISGLLPRNWIERPRP